MRLTKELGISWLQRQSDVDNKPGERLLADFKLLQQVGQKMAKSLVADAALYHVEIVVRFLHDAQPRFVNRLEPLRLLYGQTAEFVNQIIDD